MRLSELQDKDIINLADGLKIGNIIDIKINIDGSIDSLIVEKKIKKFLSTSDELEIKWNSIKKIGEDVILIDSKLF